MPDLPAPAPRFLLWEIVALLAALAVTGGFFYRQYHIQQTLIAEQHTMALDVAYRATIETHRLDVATRFRLQVMRPEVLDLMEEALVTPEERMPALRGRLYRLLKPVYDELRQTGLHQFQFHLADDRALLRFHAPQKAGDPLFALRPSLRIANREMRPVTGLEVGRTQPGFRYVFPITRADRHLGSVELSLPFERIKENLNQLLGQGDFGFLLEREAILETIDAENREKFVEAPIHAGFFIENPTISRVARNFTQSATVRALEPLLRADPLIQERMRTHASFVAPLIHAGQGYAVAFLAVPDLNGKPLAYVLRFTATNALHELRDGLLRQGLLAMLLILALAATVHWLRRQRAQLREDVKRRKAAEARIEKLAHHDTLTGLLNRYSLENYLEQSLHAAHREGQHVAVLFIDMDRFKDINDSLGHHMGDRLLQEVAQRLLACVRESDIVARQGGDEFVVALTGLAASHDAVPVTNKLLHTLAEVYRIDGYTLHSSPSIGIALYPDDGDSVEILLKNADTAMYHAKDNGRNNLQYFTAAMTVAANERLELERDLHAALAAQEFELFYQPQVAATSRLVFSVEALLRWRHPVRGMVPPDSFIPIAEDAGLIETIGGWVLDEACRQLAAWRQAGITGLRMAVNLSAHQLRSPRFVALVRDCMTRHGISGGELELEVTESVAMESPAQAIDQLRALRDLGVLLAIDDFGTGYSSLAYLKHLPIQTLKLDRSFVRDIETDANDATISAATVALAHALGLVVVAEGVETEAQARFLGNAHGCDILQGYLFGRPEPAAAVVDLLRRQVTSEAACISASE